MTTPPPVLQIKSFNEKSFDQALVEFVEGQCRACLHIVATTPSPLLSGLCIECRRDVFHDYRWVGTLETSWRFDFKSKEWQPVAPVTIDWLRARCDETKQSAARWTHAAADGSRLCCGIAHKERDAKCPAMTCSLGRPECLKAENPQCGHRQTWAIAPLNAHAEAELSHEEARWRFAYVLPLVEGLRSASKKDAFRFRNISSPDEQEGVRRLYWHAAYGSHPESLTAIDPEKPKPASSKGLGGRRKRPTVSGR